MIFVEYILQLLNQNKPQVHNLPAEQSEYEHREQHSAHYIRHSEHVNSTHTSPYVSPGQALLREGNQTEPYLFNRFKFNIHLKSIYIWARFVTNCTNPYTLPVPYYQYTLSNGCQRTQAQQDACLSEWRLHYILGMINGISRQWPLINNQFLQVCRIALLRVVKWPNCWNMIKQWCRKWSLEIMSFLFKLGIIKVQIIALLRSCSFCVCVGKLSTRHIKPWVVIGLVLSPSMSCFQPVSGNKKSNNYPVKDAH